MLEHQRLQLCERVSVTAELLYGVLTAGRAALAKRRSLGLALGVSFPPAASAGESRKRGAAVHRSRSPGLLMMMPWSIWREFQALNVVYEL